MTNKQLQEYLQQFPDDMEVVMAIDGVCFTDINRPIKRLFSPLKGEQVEKITLRQKV